jgi:hypothetical protein
VANPSSPYLSILCKTNGCQDDAVIPTSTPSPLSPISHQQTTTMAPTTPSNPKAKEITSLIPSRECRIHHPTTTTTTKPKFSFIAYNNRNFWLLFG